MGDDLRPFQGGQLADEVDYAHIADQGDVEPAVVDSSLWRCEQAGAETAPVAGYHGEGAALPVEPFIRLYRQQWLPVSEKGGQDRPQITQVGPEPPAAALQFLDDRCADADIRHIDEVA